MSVQLGHVVIPAHFVRMFEAFIGGGIILNGAFINDEAPDLKDRIISLEQGDVIQLRSYKINAIVQIKNINIESKNVNNKIIQVFNVELSQIA